MKLYVQLLTLDLHEALHATILTPPYARLRLNTDSKVRNLDPDLVFHLNNTPHSVQKILALDVISSFQDSSLSTSRILMYTYT